MKEYKLLYRETKKGNVTEKIADALKNFPNDEIFSNGWTVKDIEKKIANLDTCMQNTITGSIEGKTDERKILQSYMCGNYAFCPHCSAKKRADTIRNIYTRYLIVLSMAKAHVLNVYELTITQEDSTEIKYDSLRASWTRFIDNDGSEGKKIIGYIMSIEIKPKYAEFGTTCEGYHTHAHCIVITKDILNYEIYDQEEKTKMTKQFGEGNIPKCLLDKIKLDPINSKLSKDWAKAIRIGKDKSSNIHCDIISPYNSQENKERLFETIKYLVKTDDETGEEIIKIMIAAHGKKRVTIAGIMKQKDLNIFDIIENNQKLKEKTKKYYNRRLYETYCEKKPESYPRNAERTTIKDGKIIKIKSRGADILNLAYKKSEIGKDMQGARNRQTATIKAMRTWTFKDYKAGNITSDQYHQMIEAIEKQNKETKLNIKKHYFSLWCEYVKKHGAKEVIKEIYGIKNQQKNTKNISD